MPVTMNARDASRELAGIVVDWAADLRRVAELLRDGKIDQALILVIGLQGETNRARWLVEKASAWPLISEDFMRLAAGDREGSQSETLRIEGTVGRG